MFRRILKKKKLITQVIIFIEQGSLFYLNQIEKKKKRTTITKIHTRSDHNNLEIKLISKELKYNVFLLIFSQLNTKIMK
jgi:hypothetical protein